jgi:hypothetical protein
MSRLPARAFATHRDLVPQGIAVPPESGCEPPQNQFLGVPTPKGAPEIVIVSVCFYSSFQLDDVACFRRGRWLPSFDQAGIKRSHWIGINREN